MAAQVNIHNATDVQIMTTRYNEFIAYDLVFKDKDGNSELSVRMFTEYNNTNSISFTHEAEVDRRKNIA